MKLIVGINKVTIDEKDKLNAGEYNIHDVEFEFDSVYNDLVKKAVFSNKEHNYLVSIENNRCVMPYEVLSTIGDVNIGVYAYEVDNDELVLRYSPTPAYVYVDLGSYKDSYDNYNVPTADVVEQLEQEINDKQDKLVSGENIKTINGETILGEGNIVIQSGGADIEAGENINFTEDQVTGKTIINAVDTIYDDTEIKSDITNLQNNKANISDIPDVSNFITKSVDDLVNYYKKSETYTQTEVNQLIGAITTLNILVVQELPTQDISTTTIYLVPKATSQTNNAYDEYIYVSNNWEKIGDTEIDLTNYVQKSQTSGLIKNDGTIDTNTYLTQHQDISGKEDKTNKVTSINSSSTDTQYPSAKCVYDIVGDIATALNTINGENI